MGYLGYGMDAYEDELEQFGFDGFYGFVDVVAHEVNRVFFGGELPELNVECGDYRRSDGTMLLGVYVHPGEDERFPGHTLIINPRGHELPVEDGVFDNLYTGIIDTVVHELVHCYCYVNGIQDVDPDGRHNEKFRDAALSHDLLCECRNDGWGATGLGIEGWAAILCECDQLGEILYSI